MNGSQCNLCGKDAVVSVLSSGVQPISQHLLSSMDQIPYQHPHTLGHCGHCGLVQLINPAPPDFFYSEYFTLSAWKQQPHISELLQLATKNSSLPKTVKIVEVGSNDGTFLRLLRDMGYANVSGIEPANDAVRAAQASQIPTMQAFLTDESADLFVSQFGRQNVLICRHVIEHIQALPSFAASLRRILAPDAHVVFEVPNGAAVFDWLDYSGLWDQHCNYFSPELFRYFASLVGVETNCHYTVSFSGVAQVLSGNFSNRLPIPLPTNAASSRAALTTFTESTSQFKKEFSLFLQKYQSQGRKVITFGAGSRTTTFINLLDLGPYITAIVDDQNEKQGKFLPGSKLPILSASESKSQWGNDPLILLGVNYENEDRVIDRHSLMNLAHADVFSIHPPSSRLAPPWRHVKPTLAKCFTRSALV